MNTEEFLLVSVPQLTALTNIPEDTWRQYLYKEATPGMNFMRKATAKLGMNLDELDRAIQTRRNLIRKQRQIREEVDQLIAANS